MLALAVGLGVAGCAGVEEPGGTTSSSPSTEASTTPTPSPASESPSPAAEASADPGTETPGANAITTPADGATVAGPQVTVTGVGTAVEATLRWRVLTAGTTDIVKEDFTTAGANGEIGPFTFTVALPAGSYTLEVWEPGASDTATPRHALVTSTFTVT